MARAQTLYYICLLIVSALTADATETGIAYINEEAELHCKFKDLQNPSVGKVDYYWQQGDDLVNSLSDAKASIIERYRNRTVVLSNGHLRIFNVTIEDEGVYTCHRIVLINNVRQKEGECQFQLSVIANYSMPKIEVAIDLGKPDSESSVKELRNGTAISYEVKNGSVMYLKCTSVNGYPKPKRLDWYLSTGNTTQNQDGSESIQFNNISRLYNISRRFQWKVDEDVTITCSVETQYTTVVQVMQIVVKKEIPSNVPDQKHILIIGVIILISILGVSLFLVYYKKRKHRNTGQCMCRRSSRQEVVEAANNTEGRELMSTNPEAATV